MLTIRSYYESREASEDKRHNLLVCNNQLIVGHLHTSDRIRCFEGFPHVDYVAVTLLCRKAQWKRVSFLCILPSRLAVRVIYVMNGHHIDQVDKLNLIKHNISVTIAVIVAALLLA